MFAASLITILTARLWHEFLLLLLLLVFIRVHSLAAFFGRCGRRLIFLLLLRLALLLRLRLAF